MLHLDQSCACSCCATCDLFSCFVVGVFRLNLGMDAARLSSPESRLSLIQPGLLHLLVLQKRWLSWRCDGRLERLAAKLWSRNLCSSFIVCSPWLPRHLVLLRLLLRLLLNQSMIHHRTRCGVRWTSVSRDFTP